MAGKVKFSASTASAIAFSAIRRGTMGKSKGSKGKQSRKGGAAAVFYMGGKAGSKGGGTIPW